MAAGEVIAVLSLRSAVPAEIQFLFAHGEITCIDDFRNDVDAILELERDKIWLTVLDLVQNGLFAGGAADVSEGVVVIDRRNEERRARGFSVERIIKSKLGRVGRPELIDLLFGQRLCRANLLRCLDMNGF